jgi:signal transduction histidine kinase
LIVASLVTVASYLGATVYTQNRLARLDAVSSTLEGNAIPSIDYLSRAAVSLSRLNELVNGMAAPADRRAEAVQAVTHEADALDDDVSQYLKLPPLAGEQQFWTALRANIDHAQQLLRRSVHDAEAGSPAATVLQNGGLDDALDLATASTLATIDFDVRQSESMARDIRGVRVSTLRAIVALDSAATIAALLGLAVAFRASRQHDELIQAHASVLSDRVAELDLFAGRVAHDVLSPLGAIAASLSLLGRSADARERGYIERSQRALRRVRQLVDGLLTFARSGARPDGDATCALESVLPGIVADCREESEEKRIELVVDVAGPLTIRCGAGVITSIIQNLVRNAIKYMGDSAERRVVVYARARGRVARVEVRDTGVGIPPELRDAIFEPFVRGEHETVGGTGLGLATVKRLVTSHGGSVGVESRVGAGSAFWVELPLAATPSSTAG